MNEQKAKVSKAIGIKFVLISMFIVCSLVGSRIYYLRTSRDIPGRNNCMDGLRQLALATLNYESTFDSLPIGIEISPDGKRMHSWRARILPFLHTGRFQYDFEQPWDSKAFSDARLDSNFDVGRVVLETSFNCVSDQIECKKHSQINYLAVTGEGTLFPINRAVKIDEITDGTGNTILFVESLDTRIRWTEPRDLDINTMSMKINDRSKPGISSRHPGGANVVFADGSTHFITDKITPSELRALLTIAGGEDVNRKELAQRGIIHSHRNMESNTQDMIDTPWNELLASTSSSLDQAIKDLEEPTRSDQYDQR